MAGTQTDAMLGTEIGRYRLTRLLGEGGMGRVYLGEQPAIGSRVAIKILSEECTRNPELLDRFFAEAHAVNLIRHENIISVLDLALLADGRPYIVMEFIEGQTLAHHVRRAAAPLGGVAQVMGEVLSGLAAAHAIGIVHRDLKPDNVIITVEGHAKVLDFGIAKLAPGLRADVSPRTKTGALLGTPAYMAPEQISGAGNVDARTDIYAAGIVLYEAVTGVAPFTGSTLFDIMRAHLEDTPVPPRQRRGDLPQAFEDVILQAMAKDPAHRFQSVQAMAQALSHAASTLPPEQWQPLSSRGVPRISAAGGQGHPSSQTPAVRSTAIAAPATAARNRRTGRRIALAAAALVAIGITLVAVSSGSKPDAVAVAAAEAGTVDVRADAVAVATMAPDAGTARVAVIGQAPTQPVVKRPSTATPMDAGVPLTVDAAGSATVQIGPNVHIGPNVTIGTGKPSREIRKPADYNVKSFDPIAYLPTALAFARKLLPDARLTELSVTRVFSSGAADLSTGSKAQFEFRSPAGSKRPAGVAPNENPELDCMIHVELGAKEVSARIVNTDDCDNPFVRAPRCPLAGVWKQAIADGAPASHAAKISWLFDEKWFVDTGPTGYSGTILDCP